MPETEIHHYDDSVQSRHRVIGADGAALSVLVARPTAPDPSASPLPPILAIHGFASSAANGWGRTGHLGALARAGRTVVAVDLRGHGESAKPHDAAAYTLATVLDDLQAVARAIPDITTGMTNSSYLDVIGYSLGARLAWTAACRRTVPIRRLVLGGFDGRPLFDGVDPERLDKLAAAVPSNDLVALRALVEGLSGTGTAPEDPPLTPIPTLVVAGDQDPVASGAAAFAEGLPMAEFLSVPGRNHISAVPAKVYRQALVTFLAR